jgi:hypothetical protein
MENYKEYLEQLKGDYLDTALWMESKMESNWFDIEDKNNAMNEIIDMLLCAQEAGRSVEATIGKSRTKFFLQYKKAILPYQNVKSLLWELFSLFFCMLIMSACYEAFDNIGKKDAFSQTINVLPVIIMGLFLCSVGEYTDRRLKMRNYNQTQKVKRRRNFIRFGLQTIAIVIIMIPISYFDLEWMVKFSDVVWTFVGLSIVVLLLNIIFGSFSRLTGGLEVKLIQNVQRDYRKKRREKGWDKDRYIKSKKVYIFYLLPVLSTILVVELVYILFLLAGDAIQGGSGDRIFFFVILFCAIMVSYILIGATIYNRGILNKLMDGSIQLENDL